MPKNSGSNRSTRSRKAPCRVIILPWRFDVRVIVGVDVPAIGRHLHEGVTAVAQQLPELRRARTARHATAEARRLPSVRDATVPPPRRRACSSSTARSARFNGERLANRSAIGMEPGAHSDSRRLLNSASTSSSDILSISSGARAGRGRVSTSSAGTRAGAQRRPSPIEIGRNRLDCRRVEDQASPAACARAPALRQHVAELDCHQRVDAEIHQALRRSGGCEGSRRSTSTIAIGTNRDQCLVPLGGRQFRQRVADAAPFRCLTADRAWRERRRRP